MVMEGQIDEIFPDGRFGVKLDNEHRIIAYPAGKMRRFRIKSVVGDRVHVEMTPYDLQKGRITFRHNTGGGGAIAKHIEFFGWQIANHRQVLCRGREVLPDGQK